MDNDELILPPPNSHWSLRLVDIKKPFPSQILANVTYKLLCFFYPPISLDVVELTHVVSNPELNAFNVGLFLSLVLVLSYVAYVGFKFFRKAKTPVRTNIPEELAKSNEGVVEDKDKDKENDVKFPKENDVKFPNKEDKDGHEQDNLAEKIERAVWERPVPKRQQKPKKRA